MCSRTLTQWGRMTHICASKLTTIGPDNGLSPGRRQAITWTNAGLLPVELVRTNFSKIRSRIISFSLKKMHLKMSSAKWRQFCLGLNVLRVFKSNCKQKSQNDRMMPWRGRAQKLKQSHAENHDKNKKCSNYRYHCPTLGVVCNYGSRWVLTYPDSKVHGANTGPIWGR